MNKKVALFDENYYKNKFTKVVVDLGEELSSDNTITEVVIAQIKYLKRKLSEVEEIFNRDDVEIQPLNSILIETILNGKVIQKEVFAEGIPWL